MLQWLGGGFEQGGRSSPCYVGAQGGSAVCKKSGFDSLLQIFTIRKTIVAAPIPDGVAAVRGLLFLACVTEDLELTGRTRYEGNLG